MENKNISMILSDNQIEEVVGGTLKSKAAAAGSWLLEHVIGATLVGVVCVAVVVGVAANAGIGHGTHKVKDPKDSSKEIDVRTWNFRFWTKNFWTHGDK